MSAVRVNYYWMTTTETEGYGRAFAYSHPTDREQ